jgi:hypothetical protein
MNLMIVSGGQTGVDRAALTWAMRRGFLHGGWCPRSRWSEDGPIPHKFHLKETPSRAAGERTLWNVRDSDATVIITMKEFLSGGTARTARFCNELSRPVVLLSSAVFTPREAGAALRHFVLKHRVRRLNVAGPRASEEPGAAAFAHAVLDAAFHTSAQGTAKARAAC